MSRSDVLFSKVTLLSRKSNSRLLSTEAVLAWLKARPMGKASQLSKEPSLPLPHLLESAGHQSVAAQIPHASEGWKPRTWRKAALWWAGERLQGQSGLVSFRDRARCHSFQTFCYSPRKQTELRWLSPLYRWDTEVQRRWGLVKRCVANTRAKLRIGRQAHWTHVSIALGRPCCTFCHGHSGGSKILYFCDSCKSLPTISSIPLFSFDLWSVSAFFTLRSYPQPLWSLEPAIWLLCLEFSLRQQNKTIALNIPEVFYFSELCGSAKASKTQNSTQVLRWQHDSHRPNSSYIYI